MSVKLIALDLDGTLLNSRKEISPGNRAALQAAAARGIPVVPSSGRNFEGMPEEIRTLPEARYFITCDGALIYDRETYRTIHSIGIPKEEALEILSFLTACDGIADFYADGHCYTSRENLARLCEIGIPPRQADYIRWSRIVVDSLEETMRAAETVHLLQLFLRNPPEKETVMEDLSRRFPNLTVSTSISNNIEMNYHTATKGSALTALCRILEIPVADSVAFGDQLNDLPMLRAAGLGVAMGNAPDCVRRAADCTTKTNEEDGVAVLLQELLSDRKE